MNKRLELLKFARLNGLQIKACKRSRTVTSFNPKNNWVECFDNWEQAHAYFLEAVIAYRDFGSAYAWERRIITVLTVRP